MFLMFWCFQSWCSVPPKWEGHREYVFFLWVLFGVLFCASPIPIYLFVFAFRLFWFCCFSAHFLKMFLCFCDFLILCLFASAFLLLARFLLVCIYTASPSFLSLASLVLIFLCLRFLCCAAWHLSACVFPCFVGLCFFLSIPQPNPNQTDP